MQAKFESLLIIVAAMIVIYTLSMAACLVVEWIVGG